MGSRLTSDSMDESPRPCHLDRVEESPLRPNRPLREASLRLGSCLAALTALLPAVAIAGSGTPDAASYQGLPVAMVSLEAVDGGLPGENLEPLLNVQQGRPYRPRDVRADLAMLHRVGQFAAVEAEVEPWVDYDAEGNPSSALWVVYRVEPPPRVRRVRVNGENALSGREIQAICGLATGDAFFESQDAAAVARRIQARYEEIGFPSAHVTVGTRRVTGRRVDVILDVSEGPPQLLESVRVLRMPALPSKALSRELRRARLREGHPAATASILKAQQGLTDMLHRRGYPEARVRTVQFRAGAEHQNTSVTFVAEPREHLDIDIKGGGLFGSARIEKLVRDTIGAGHVSGELLGEVRERVRQDLAEAGFLEAQVEIAPVQGPGSTSVKVAVKRGFRHRLKRMTFEGAKAFSEHYLSDAMKEADPEVLGAHHVSAAAVDHAIEQVQEFYRSQGYLAISMRRTAIEAGKPGLFGVVPVDVHVDVAEGPLTRLASLSLDGDIGPGQPALDLRAADLLGKPLNPAAIDMLAREIVSAYEEEGYLDADAKPERTVSEVVPTSAAPASVERSGSKGEDLPPAQEAAVVIHVEPGPRVFLRNVIIQGQRRTRRLVIEHEVLLHTGEAIVASSLSKTREKLYALGLFRSVEPTLVGDEDRIKDLLVVVEEQPNIALEVGGGASTDEGVRFFFRATHRNLWGLAHRLSFLGQVGLGYAGGGSVWALDTSQPEWKAALRYEAPNVPGLAERFFADALLDEENQEPTYRLYRSGFGVGLQSGVGPRGQFVLDYRVEWRQLQDVDPGALLEGDPWLPLLGLPSTLRDTGAGFDITALGTPQTPSEHRSVSGLGAVLILDRRDDPTNPRRGAHWTFQARANDGLFSPNPAIIAQTRLVELFPLGALGLLFAAQGGAAGTLDRDDTVALEDRFRLGGAGSLRGFEMDTVGPKNRVESVDVDFPNEIDPLIRYSRRTDPYRWVPTGGDGMLAFTAELKVPAPLLGFRKFPDAAIVGFVDAGNVYLLKATERTTSTLLGGEPFLRTSFGVGFRYATPVGPLQLDVGINPDPLTRRGEESYRIHLSLGTL
jgi:outer membrane protein insertion porin family